MEKKLLCGRCSHEGHCLISLERRITKCRQYNAKYRKFSRKLQTGPYWNPKEALNKQIEDLVQQKRLIGECFHPSEIIEGFVAISKISHIVEKIVQKDDDTILRCKTLITPVGIALALLIDSKAPFEIRPRVIGKRDENGIITEIAVISFDIIYGKSKPLNK